jgi:hypothetical protein
MAPATLINDINDFESGEQPFEDNARMFQHLVNTGTAWQLQGVYGRHAMELINAGVIALGHEAHRDYYGSLIPSRFDVAPGTKGSVGYVEAHGYTVQE